MRGTASRQTKILNIIIMENCRAIQVKKHIESIDDVREFFRDLKRENLNIHPEDTFFDCYYMQEDVGLSVETITRLDETLNRVWDICEDEGVDPCEIAWEEYECDKMFGIKEG